MKKMVFLRLLMMRAAVICTAAWLGMLPLEAAQKRVVKVAVFPLAPL